MLPRLVIAGLAGLLAAPAFVIAPASAAVLFSCDSVTGSATYSPGLTLAYRAQAVGSGPTAPAGSADMFLASTSDNGIKSNGTSEFGSLSGDGTRVSFFSQGTNMDPAVTDNGGEVFVKDLTTGDLTLASSSDGGVAGDGQTAYSSMSGDGSQVAFFSFAANLDPADADHTPDVYVKELTSGNIILASTSDLGVKGNSYSGVPSLSEDASRVAFPSAASNLDPADLDSQVDVYVKDLTTGDITLASTSDTGVNGNNTSDDVSLSADGTKVAFSSSATNLDPADTDSQYDVYVKDLTTGDITLASTSDSGVKADRGGDVPALSADGSKVAFSSSATNLDPADTDTNADVYVKDLTTGDIMLASTSDRGVKGNGTSGGTFVSGDGTKVAFSSGANNLDPADTDQGGDIYVKNLATGDITLASTSDTGVKKQSGFLAPASVSLDGTHVAMSGDAGGLDPGDGDSLRDVYVKQLPATPTSIAIDGCSNGQSGTASVVELRTYGSRPLRCPASMRGGGTEDYPDTTPIFIGSNPSLRIDWASGPDSFGVAKLKMGTTGTQWRAVFAIQASPGHDTPATNQYLPTPGSGFTKTKLKGRIDWSALDSFNCTSGTADPISWLDLVNNGSFIVKNA